MAWNDVLVFLKSIDEVRHARFHTPPVIANHRENIIAPAVNANNRKLALLISDLYPEPGAYYQQQNDGNQPQRKHHNLDSLCGSIR